MGISCSESCLTAFNSGYELTGYTAKDITDTAEKEFQEVMS
jgi:hypothetical protein